MHAYASLAAALVAASTVAGHPICFIGDRAPDLARTLTYCPAARDGACCTDVEEAEVQARVAAAGPLSGDCADLYKEVRFFYVWQGLAHVNYSIYVRTYGF